MDAADFRRKAERCRLLSTIAIGRKAKEQLQIWARDFDDVADTIEKTGDAAPECAAADVAKC